MKRRNLMLASAGMATVLLPDLGRAAQPCPPPLVTAMGGTSATTTCPTASYTASPSITENPISEGGAWLSGGKDALDWLNVRKGGGKIYGVGPSTDYNDCAACLNVFGSTSKHYVQATIYRAAGYSAPSTHEVELLLGVSMSAHDIRAYELDFWFEGNLQPVRWNGSVGNFDTGALRIVSGSWPNSLANGDVIRAEFDSSSGSPTISLYLNGRLTVVMTDTSAGKITSGSPGIGFFARSGSGLVMDGYCFSAVSAGT